MDAVTEMYPYGSWPSPITASLLVEKAVSLSYPTFSAGSLYWLEARPFEQGRSVVVQKRPDGATVDRFSAPFSARSTVHEYGGRPYVVVGETVYFSNFEDQAIYRASNTGEPVPITDASNAMNVRYVAPVATPDGRWLVAVRERHLDSGVENDVVAISTDGSFVEIALAYGHDFYGSPAVSPDGRRVAWCSWDHPNMPWDETTLYEAEFDASPGVAAARIVAGGANESITQPRYDHAGVLHLISDRSGWWNLYADGEDGIGAIAPDAAEYASPDWVFGLASYGFSTDSKIVAVRSSQGLDRIGVISPGNGAMDDLGVAYSSIGSLCVVDDRVYAVCASATTPACIAEISSAGGTTRLHRMSRESSIDPSYLSVPEPISFPSSGGRVAHGFFYAPTNPRAFGPDDERPPLIVASHGGPTSAASSQLRYDIQFWTSRGFGLVDVNYAGSSGYGREYRNALRGSWGIYDVEDCIAAAHYLAARGDADSSRLVIHGGSAGGYTTLCALTFSNAFAAGASYYGVADVTALAKETHKFESRYLDSLIGPWPSAHQRYEDRSPIFHTEQMSTPIALFQGLEDRVVPPDQAEMMAEALRERHVPFALLFYAGEQHGFRRAEHIIRTAEAELYFYGKVLGFEPADEIEPVEIENADRLSH